jgi:hypothetical protein
VQFTFKALVLAVALFAMMLALQELGRRLGRRRAARDAEGARAGAGVVDGADFGLRGRLADRRRQPMMFTPPST